MNLEVLELVLLDYVFMWTLALGFFRRSERPPLAWWLTGLHFVCVPFVLIVAWFVRLPVFWWSVGHSRPVLNAIAVLLAAGSMILLALTRGNQRERLSQWHLQDDASESIVSWGPHGVIRHPFYVGYILGALAALFLAPGLPTLVCLLYTVIALALTARREEKRLLSSSLGAEYASYRARTGGFWPRWSSNNRA